MSANVQNGLEEAARRAGISSRRMMSGAGHDAMSFASLCETGMVFIPCLKGFPITARSSPPFPRYATVRA